MKTATAYITSDGVTHLDRERAIRHAQGRYGDALTKLARGVAMVQKYGEAITFIEENLQAFIQLHALQSDIEVPDEPADLED